MSTRRRYEVGQRVTLDIIDKVKTGTVVERKRGGWYYLIRLDSMTKPLWFRLAEITAARTAQ